MTARAVTPAARAAAACCRRAFTPPRARPRHRWRRLGKFSRAGRAHRLHSRTRRKERVMSSSNNVLWGGIVGAFGVALGIAAGCQSEPKDSTRDIPASAETRSELGIYKWHFVVDDGYGFEL